MAALERRGIGFHFLTEAIDTTKPGWMLVFHLFARRGSSSATWPGALRPSAA